MTSWRRLIAAACALAVLPGAAAAAPQRIMSANGCADLLLLQLVPRSKIVSVTYRAERAARGVADGLAQGVATNDGRPEEVVRDQPDLLVAGRFTTPRTKDFARRAGVPVLELDDAVSFEDIRRNLRRLGAATGETARAEALVQRLDRWLAELKALPAPGPLSVAAWSGGGIVLGEGTLADAVIEAAGARNIAADQAALAFGDFDLERLLQARPDLLLQTEANGAPSLQRQHGRHGLVRRLYQARVVSAPEATLNCGLPQSAETAVRLRRALIAARPLAVR